MRATRVVCAAAVTVAIAVVATMSPSAASTARSGDSPPARTAALEPSSSRDAPRADAAEGVVQPLTIGSLVTDRLDVPGAELIYAFTATAGQRILPDVLAGSGIVSSWNLRTADGSTVFNTGFSDAVRPYTLTAGVHTLTITGDPGDLEFRIWPVPSAQAFPLTPGSSVADGIPSAGAGRLESPGALDTYTFTATAGQRILAQTESTSGSKQWNLRGPDGTTLFDGSFYSQASPQVLTAGVHTLTVTGDPGPYGFKVSTVPAAQTFALPLGTSVSDGVPSAGAGRLETPGAQDTYTFTATAGQRILAQTESGNGPARWNLRGPDGTVVFDYGWGNPGGPFVLTAGIHTLTVTGDPGPYSFKVSTVPAAQTFALPLGTSVSDGVPSAGAGRLETPGAQDTYAFTATAGQRILAQTESSSGTKAWNLRGPDGTVVFDYGWGNPGGPFVLTAGVHTLTVTGDPGVYGFKVSTVPDPQSFTLPLGTSVSDGVPSAGAGRLETPGAEDTYTFTATAGQKIVAQTESGTGSLRWNLRGPDGSFVFDYGWGNPGGPFLLAAGTYTLTVTGDPGPYGFKVSLSANPPVASGPATTAFSTSIGATVSTGVPVAGAGVVGPNEQDVFAFTGNAGQAIWLRSDSGDSYHRFSLRAPNGSALASGYFGSGNDAGEVALPTTGTYRLYLTNVSGGQAISSNYGFTILSRPAPQVFAITVGTTVTDGAPAAGAGRIESIGGRDRYTFTASVGDRVRLKDLTDGNPGQRLQLRSPSGQVLATDQLNGSDDVGIVTLPLVGSYTVDVAGLPTSRVTGAYSFSLDAAPAPQLLALPLGSSVSDGVPSAGAGRIEAPGSTDVYSFVGTAGQRVWFQDVNDSQTQFRWTVRAPDGSTLGTDTLDGSGQGLGAQTLPQTGTYLMVVQASPPARTTGTYSFKTWAVPAADSFTVSTGTTVSDGQPSAGAGRIESPGARDRYQFTGTIGQRIWFDNLTDQNRSLSWELRGTDGTVLFDRPLDASTDPGPITLPSSGTYRIQVASSAQNPATGPYSFAIRAVPAVQTFALTAGTAVSDGQPAAGAGRIEAVGSQDVYTFTAKAGQSLWFDDRTDQSNGLRWLLRSPDGTSLFDSTLSGSDPGRKTLPRSGQYRIEVSSPQDRTGPYAFTMWATSVQQFTTTVGTTVSNGIPSSGAGSIESPGAIDEYRFDGTAGQVIKFENLTGVSHSLGWRLRDPNGLTVFDAYLTPGSSVTNQTLPFTGQYTIEVRARTDDFGPYSFRTLAQGTDTSALPQADDFELELNPDATVATNKPQPGAGLLGGARAMDVYHFVGESGQAVSFKIDQGCTSSQRWVLRDPAGSTVFDDTLCATQTVVLPDAGSYTLSVGGGASGALYGFTVWSIESRREAPKAGQTPAPPVLRSIQPATAAAGGTASVSVLAQHMPKPTILKVSRNGTPLTIKDVTFRSALTSLDSPVAIARLDLAGAALGAYDVTITLPGGATKVLTGAFTVVPAVEPQIDLRIDNRPSMRVGSVNRAFVTATNRSPSDYYGAFIKVRVPCGTDARAELPPFPRAELKQFLTDRGSPAASVALVDQIPADNTGTPYVGPDGSCSIDVQISRIPSGGEVTFPVTLKPTTVGDGAIDVGTVDAAPTASNPTPATGGHSSLTGPGTYESITTTRINASADHVAKPRPTQEQTESTVHFLAEFLTRGVAPALQNNATGIGVYGTMLSGLAAIYGPQLATVGAAIVAAAPYIAVAVLVVVAAVAVYYAVTALVRFFQSADPNEIIGTVGRGKAGGVAAGDRLSYTVFFENKATATAAAQFVRVALPLDSDLDLASLRFEAANVGGKEAVISASSATSMTGSVQIPLNGGTTVAVGGSVKASTRVLTATFAGPPGLNDPFAPTPYKDFLPPNTTSPNGEGYVRFSVRTKSSLAYGTQVKAKATVYFDEHENGGTSLATNEWLNTISPPWSPFASWSAFVDRQYKDVLGRAPTTAERSAAVAKLTAGAKAGSIASGLRRSTDAVNNVDPVTRLYSAYFLRIPDRSGLSYWIGQKRAGKGLATISEGFAKSAEFKRRYGTLSNNAFVKKVYLNVLGRPGDAAGIAYWTKALDTKQRTRGQVMIGYSNSAEYRKSQAAEVDVSVAHIALLGRAPTTTEFTSGVKALESTTPLTTFLTNLLDSAEYDTHITG